MWYKPSYELLKKYADVLVKFALRSGEWVKKHDVVFVQLPECAKAFYLPLQKSILESWAYPIFEYIPDGVARHFFENANDQQLTFYPSHYLHGKLKQMTHVISIIAENDKHELKWVDPKKISARIKSRQQYFEKRVKKENEGKMTWTLWLFATPAMAKEAGMNLEQYWKQIIKACYLDNKDPIKKWKETFAKTELIKKKLDNLKIQSVNIKWKDVDLDIKIWSDRKWLGWWWRNIPSFEIFTSPDRRGTNGWIRFNQPLYYFSQKISWIQLWFEKWKIIKFDAKENKELLSELIKIPNADKLWEFSMTDARFSHITKFMAETLYDENIWWKYGNTHIAIWRSYEETYIWDVSKLSQKQKEKLWFNFSPEHRDLISTTNRVVTATLVNWKKKVIYKDGKFTL